MISVFLSLSVCLSLFLSLTLYLSFTPPLSLNLSLYIFLSLSHSLPLFPSFSLNLSLSLSTSLFLPLSHSPLPSLSYPRLFTCIRSMTGIYNFSSIHTDRNSEFPLKLIKSVPFPPFLKHLRKRTQGKLCKQTNVLISHGVKTLSPQARPLAEEKHKTLSTHLRQRVRSKFVYSLSSENTPFFQPCKHNLSPL